MPLTHQVESLERARNAAWSQAETPARELEQVLATRAQALHTSKVTHLKADPTCLVNASLTAYTCIMQAS